MRTFTHIQRILFFTLLFGLFAQGASASDPDKPIRINQENLAKLSAEDQARVLEIACRLETIADVDRSTLTSEERKALRTETRALRQEAAEFNRGGSVIIISATTLIIILLIILIVT